MARKRLRGVRLDPELDEWFAQFCELTHRDPSDVIRTVLHLFLVDGPQAAELRLTQRLWDQKKGKDGVVVAMREEHPPEGGRQLVVYTPQGYRGSEERLKQRVAEAAQAGNVEVAKGREAFQAALEAFGQDLDALVESRVKVARGKSAQPRAGRRKKAAGGG